MANTPNGPDVSFTMFMDLFKELMSVLNDH